MRKVWWKDNGVAAQMYKVRLFIVIESSVLLMFAMKRMTVCRGLGMI
jgi:hypothetical protein